MIDKSLSIVLTVHNKGWLLGSVLSSIIVNTNEKFELIIILDGCSDNSEEIVNKYKKILPSHIALRVLYEPNVFETKANNAGLRVATGKYAIIIQDDMILNEIDWQTRLRDPAILFDDVFAVTSRCAHNWVYNPANKYEFSKPPGGIWSDVLKHVDHAHSMNTPRNQFVIRDCVNRGPLLVKMDVMEKLNYLDEVFSPQDMDDHDLCYRAYRELGMVAGIHWIDYLSADKWGGTRIDGGPAQWLLDANHKNVNLVWNRHHELIMGPKHDEIRMMKD